MKEHSYPTVDQDPVQNELNFLAQVGVWIYLESKRGNVRQEDYDLVQQKLNDQQKIIRKMDKV